MPVASDLNPGASTVDGGMNRRDFCSTIAAVAAVGPTGVVEPETALSDVDLASALATSSIANSSHKIFFEAAQNMGRIEDASVDLVVTSPPYPMIEMWDAIFSSQSSGVKAALERNPMRAQELMHEELDKVWAECFRLLKDWKKMSLRPLRRNLHRTGCR